MYVDEKEKKIVLRDGEKLLRTFLVFSKELLREDINDYFKREIGVLDSKELGDTPDEVCTKILDIIRKKFKLKKRDNIECVSMLNCHSAELEINTITLTEKKTQEEWKFIKKGFYFDCEAKKVIAIEVPDLYRIQELMPLLWTLYIFQEMGGRSIEQEREKE